MTAELIRKKPSKNFPVFYSLLSPLTNTLSSPLPPSILYILYCLYFSLFSLFPLPNFLLLFQRTLCILFIVFYPLTFTLRPLTPLPLLPPTWFSPPLYVSFTLFSHIPLPDLLLLQSTLCILLFFILWLSLFLLWNLPFLLLDFHFPLLLSSHSLTSPHY